MKAFKNLATALIATVFLFSCISFNKTPNETQIKTDLIGQTMRLGSTSYEIFTSLTNFKEFVIKNKSKQEGIIEFDIFMVYEDTEHGTTDPINAKIVYKKSDSKWIIVSMTGKLQR
ncbi:MAG: hypothetical protein PHI32_15415 [Dysgonamonadaceae bacterium]|nr:hypothetical protein [Dysgonamonadaceae bacterium]